MIYCFAELILFIAHKKFTGKWVKDFVPNTKLGWHRKPFKETCFLIMSSCKRRDHMNQTERRLFLIKNLLSEQTQYQNIIIPEDETKQKRLLRSLFNIRMPIPDVYKRQANGSAILMPTPIGAAKSIQALQASVTYCIKRCTCFFSFKTSRKIGLIPRK